jgi:peroxiredoxin
MNQESSFIKTQIWSIILIVLVVVMGIEILYLVNENRKLKNALKRPRGPIKILNPEEKVPSLLGINLMGEELKVEYSSSQRTILFWFSSACPSCEHNLNFWKDIFQKHNSKELRFFGVTHTGEEKTEEFVKKFQLEFPVIIVADFSLLDQYKVEVIPQTMLIDSSGVVQKVWPGPLSENYKKEIQEMIASSPGS